MKLMYICTAIILFVLSPAAAQDVLDYSMVNAVIAGVLEWKDVSLSSFSKEMRKDEELYSTFKRKGTAGKNIVFLADEQATLKNIKKYVHSELSKTGKNSVFIFYYAGHGMKRKENVYFANYDIDTERPEATGFDPLFLVEEIKANFKGQFILLMADCCYSGYLAHVAAALSKAGIKAASLTSSEASNYSTGNWTFSQTVIDCINGLALADENLDGAISLEETAREVKEAMKYRERQRNGYEPGKVNRSMVFSRTKEDGKGPEEAGGYKRGQYILALYDGKYKPARITNLDDTRATCEFYFYSEKTGRTLSFDRIRKFAFNHYKKGDKVEVVWGEKTYAAEILKVNDDFHYITYTGWPSYWDEWVMDDRIVPGETEPVTKVMVEWEGKWYPAVILKKENGRFFIHYIGYDSSWDEWVTEERIKEQ
ncbi:MAG: caspase family protein [Spirochaetales bacterium]|nr:caspase family protein [Spirochaetales bacterium]